MYLDLGGENKFCLLVKRLSQSNFDYYYTAQNFLRNDIAYYYNFNSQTIESWLPKVYFDVTCEISVDMIIEVQKFFMGENPSNKVILKDTDKDYDLINCILKEMSLVYSPDQTGNEILLKLSCDRCETRDVITFKGGWFSE